MKAPPLIKFGFTRQVVEEGKQDDSFSKLEDSLASISFAPSNREPLSGLRFPNFLFLLILLFALRSAVLLDTVAEPHYIKCVDLWGGQGVVVAAGQASGRISFVTFRRFDISQVECKHVTVFSKEDFPVMICPLLPVRVVMAVDS